MNTTTVAAGAPQVVHTGNYSYVAWRNDDGTNPTRVLYSSSTDVGQTFEEPAGFADPAATAAQDLPLLAVDGARVLCCWLDSRGATPALFANRN